MPVRVGLLCLAWLSLLATGNAQPLATTVQLPTFQVFTVDTTVSVPDRGAMYMGGIGRRRSGQTQFFPPIVGSRPALGVETGASGMRVTATIMDLPELDAQILAKAQQRAARIRGGDDDLSIDLLRDNQAQQRVARAATGSPAGGASVAEIRRAQAQEQDETARQGAAYLAQAMSAEEEGKFGVAKIYYQMAARRLAGDPQQTALGRLAALQERKAAANSGPQTTARRNK